jgi:ATP-dependent helicase/nuclease subunit B
MPAKPPFPSRVFCGWSGPIADEASAKLVELLASQGQWRKGQVIDLEKHLLLVPTKLAARLLGESLAKLAMTQAESGLMLPRIETPEQFLNWGDSQLEVAGGSDELMAWIKVLTGTSRRTLKALFPAASDDLPMDGNFTFEEAKKFGEQLNELRNQLGAAGHSFGTVKSDREPARWTQLADLEQKYLNNLEALGLTDHNHLRANLAKGEEGGPEGIEHIWVIGIPDPDLLLVQALDNLKETIGVTYMIGADESVSDGFDDQGRPISLFWKNREVDWPEFQSCVHLASDPNDSFLKLRRLIGGKIPQSGALAICACDRQKDSPRVENLIKEMGGSAINPLGRAHGEHPLHHALRAWADCLAGEDLDFQALRHATTIPMVHNFITGGVNPEHFTESNKLLDMLDQDILRLPASELIRWLPLRPETSDDRANKHLRKSNQVIPYLKKAVEKRQAHLALSWRQVLGQILEELIGTEGIDWEDEQSAFTGEVAEHLESTAQELEAALNAQGLELSMASVIRLTLETAGEKRHRPKRDTKSVNIPGWIESTWEPVPHLILLGLNDHLIPKTPHAHPFLPGKLREALGLPSSDNIFATACYNLEQLWRRRIGSGRLDIIVLQKDENSEPLRPSRILFTGSKEALSGKVTKLFEDAPESEAKPYWEIPKDHKLIPKADPATVERIKSKINATSFSAYLEDPANFWLSKVLGLSSEDHDGGELSAAAFGNMIHAVMEAFARPHLGKDRKDEPVEALTAELRSDFARLIESHVAEKFGNNPEDSVRLQKETALARLLSFAPHQAELWSQGWIIHSVETKLPDAIIEGMTIGVRYDRLDYRVVGENKEWRVFDYKTAATPDSITNAHYGKSPEGATDFTFKRKKADGEFSTMRWRNMQMPVYYECLQTILKLDEKNTLIPCYISLPADTKKTEVDTWDDYPQQRGEALKALKAIILQIKSIQPGKILQTNEDVDYPAIPTMANRPLATYLRTELLGS